ncbi:SRS domain-containing protein [Neospora caninum Liverpool]|uniref:SRS domain-containing protein n=1 Tax=Neospora caninum (strain Liverpool) TaxID=572307 RepID=F0VIU8_NEOCL|nr:SRS domain-containing protein [Neospora caninum Liverpool]CBZ53659.1 SRS domain-containing protein [Neospora caninum Liverpool]CEL67650.1 TPA: SRS domain-containing protein [Neospora caninum Liverpool]|eukprot:XP_003883691.1 SRS domain-containing protein [Neospora caninum Liverpool]
MAFSPFRSEAACAESPSSGNRGVRKRRVLLVFVSSIMLFDSFSFSWCVRALGDPGSASDPSCLTEGSVIMCVCNNKPSDQKDLTAIVSEKRNALQISCKTDALTCAPGGLQGTNVCPSTTTTLADCKTAPFRGSTAPVDINSLLIGPTTVSWENADNAVAGCTSKKMTVPPENFPLVDQKFIVGCVDRSDQSGSMKVTVTIEARASTMQDHIVKCAYGKKSNPAHQAVTLSPEKNSFTLVCGTAGEVLPTTYETNYCISDNGDDATASCQGSYAEIFPNYEQTWWTTTANTNEYKFTIPDGQFPAEEQKITVGCQKTTTESGKQRTDSEEKDSSVCSVDVTIVASAASSAALTSGLAVTLVSIVGIFYTTLL